MSSAPRIRGVLHPGDLGAVVAHHAMVYRAEHGLDSTFEDDVATAVTRAADRGFPSPREAIRIVEHDGEHAGSLALTDEGDDTAGLRWFLLDPTLRGHGLGRRLLGELLAEAEASGYARVRLATFSELEAAARLYRAYGFTLVSEDSGPRWGRDRVTFQHYELELERA